MTPSEELKATITQHILGPRGGLFALGVLIGCIIMHLYMMTYVVAPLKAQITGFEQELTEVREKVDDIAFGKMGND